MPHGTRRVGDVEIVALCDGVVGTDAATQSFPGASTAAWAETRERYPEVFDGDGWRLHVHAYLLRAGTRRMLVDTGIGPETAPAFAWTRTGGALDTELDGAGITPDDIDTVVLTHVHDDHVGWNIDPETGRPRFENARYVLHRADWDTLRESDDDEDRAIFEATLAPLERFGALDLVEVPVELLDGIVVRHAPGHTPGHQIVTIDSRDDRATLTADLFNNPVMLLQPGVNGDTDTDPELAARTRFDVIATIQAEDRIVIPAHLPEPFGRVSRDGDRHAWVPEAD
ncbi:MAG TPA: MBL fold metallo-hydrolase [Actinomycetota bacterium]|nr:MBL fold metallo-hydrolase [Actinomycetota bacterium]